MAQASASVWGRGSQHSRRVAWAPGVGMGLARAGGRRGSQGLWAQLALRRSAHSFSARSS